MGRSCNLTAAPPGCDASSRKIVWRLSWTTGQPADVKEQLGGLGMPTLPWIRIGDQNPYMLSFLHLSLYTGLCFYVLLTLRICYILSKSSISRDHPSTMPLNDKPRKVKGRWEGGEGKVCRKRKTPKRQYKNISHKAMEQRFLVVFIFLIKRDCQTHGHKE